jgi:hypothetical protein
MVAITATNSATPSPQAMLSRARLQQARNEADRAEATAEQLRDQADQAEQQAQQGQAKVGALSQQVAQTDSTYSSQLRRQVAVDGARQVQQFLAPAAQAASNGYSFPSNPLKPTANSWATVNQRVSSGRLLDQVA